MSNNLIEIYYFCSINWYLQVAICCGFLRLVLDSALTVSTWRKSWFIIHPSTHPHMINELSWSLLLILIIDYWLLIIDYCRREQLQTWCTPHSQVGQICQYLSFGTMFSEKYPISSPWPLSSWSVPCGGLRPWSRRGQVQDASAGGTGHNADD